MAPRGARRRRARGSPEAASHPATVAQPKLAFGGQAERPGPHPAMVAQAEAGVLRESGREAALTRRWSPSRSWRSGVRHRGRPTRRRSPSRSWRSGVRHRGRVPTRRWSPSRSWRSGARQRGRPAPGDGRPAEAGVRESGREGRLTRRWCRGGRPSYGDGGERLPRPRRASLSSAWRDQGKALPQAVQRSLAGSFGDADFSAVRVHEGARRGADRGAGVHRGRERLLRAGAVPVQPEGPRPGQELLRKQLAFVLQQRAGRVTNPFGSGVAVVRDPALEAEAARLAGR